MSTDTSAPQPALPSNKDLLLTTGWSMLEYFKQAIEGSKRGVDSTKWPIPAPLSGLITHQVLFRLMVAFAGKGAKTFESILVLAERDLGEDAGTLSRSLVETYARCRNIGAAGSRWAEEACLNCAYMDDAQIRMTEAWARDPQLQLSPLEAPTIEIKRLAAIQKALGLSSRKEVLDRLLPGGIEQCLRNGGLGVLYDVCYRLPSMNVHASDLAHHLEEDASGGVTISDGSNSALLSLHSAPIVFGELLDIVLYILGSECISGLTERQKHLHTILGFQEGQSPFGFDKMARPWRM